MHERQYNRLWLCFISNNLYVALFSPLADEPFLWLECLERVIATPHHYRTIENPTFFSSKLQHWAIAVKVILDLVHVVFMKTIYSIDQLSNISKQVWIHTAFVYCGTQKQTRLMLMSCLLLSCHSYRNDDYYNIIISIWKSEVLVYMYSNWTRLCKCWQNQDLNCNLIFLFFFHFGWCSMFVKLKLGGSRPDLAGA